LRCLNASEESCSDAPWLTAGLDVSLE